MVTLKILGATWAREESGSPRHSKGRSKWQVFDSTMGKGSVQ